MSKKTKVRVAPQSAESQQLQALQVELATIQRDQAAAQQAAAAPALERLTQEEQLRSELFTPEEERARLQQQFAREGQLGTIQDELLQRELDRIRQGPGATSEQQRLIGEAAESAIATGESDISRFQQQGLQQIREEFAPASGLRPGDTPVVERGLRLQEEGLRQQGQLVRGIRGQQAQALLNFPLAAGAFQQQQAAGAQQLGQAAQLFQTQLRQQAFQNQLRLSGQAAGTSLGALGGIGQGLGISEQRALSQTTTKGRDPIQTAKIVAAGIAGGVAAIPTGGLSLAAVPAIAGGAAVGAGVGGIG